MEKRSLLLFVLLLLLLTGCRPSAFGGQSIIDWVDFIKFDGKEYLGIHSGVLADTNDLGEKIGTVKFKVADNVRNPNYKTKDGDAAFHEKGTEIFQIKNQPHLIAVKDTQAMNGYRVYFSNDDIDYEWHFKDMPIEKVKAIEIYRVDSPEKEKKISALTNIEDVSNFLAILMESKVDADFYPHTQKNDPLLYKMIFFTEDPIAYKYNLFFDGQTYYWYPWDTNILSNDIKTFIDGE